MLPRYRNEDGPLSIISTAALTSIFIILKLSGIVEWSWVAVTSPLWLPYALTVAIVFASATLTLILTLSISVGGSIMRRFKK